MGLTRVNLNQSNNTPSHKNELTLNQFDTHLAVTVGLERWFLSYVFTVNLWGHKFCIFDDLPILIFGAPIIQEKTLPSPFHPISHDRAYMWSLQNSFHIEIWVFFSCEQNYIYLVRKKDAILRCILLGMHGDASMVPSWAVWMSRRKCGYGMGGFRPISATVGWLSNHKCVDYWKKKLSLEL